MSINIYKLLSNDVSKSDGDDITMLKKWDGRFTDNEISIWIKCKWN